MAGTGLADRLSGVLGREAAVNGVELVDVEIAGASHAPLVRVYLDRDGGIDIDTIAAANRWVAPLLDEQPELRDRYTLEVSSPGIDRPLRSLADFERFAGQRAEITTSQAVAERKRFTGVLEGVQGTDILIATDDGTHRLSHGSITKARLKATVDLG